MQNWLAKNITKQWNRIALQTYFWGKHPFRRDCLFFIFFKDRNLDDNATRWTIFKKLYVRFFDYNFELDSTHVRYQVNGNQEINEAMMKVKNHPDYGKCVSIIHDKFKFYGLYYLRAEYEFL